MKLLFQSDFNLAISLALCSGIYQKIQDVPSYSVEDFFWSSKHTQDIAPLTTDHILPSFILVGFGLLTSTIAFFLELLHHFFKKSRASVIDVKQSSIGRIPRRYSKRQEEVEMEELEWYMQLKSTN